MKKLLYILCSCFLLISCSEEETQNLPSSEADQSLLRFSQHSASNSGVTFQNTITETEEVNHLEWDAVYYGGGVAAGDLNGDGLPDLYFSGNQVEDAVYLNKGNFQFEDASLQAKIQEPGTWSNGVAMADVNGDGHLDIYVCRSSWRMDDDQPELRRNRLFINQKDGSFKDEAAAYGVDNIGYSTQASFFDYDHDGDLDLFLLNAPSNNLDQKIRYQETGFPEFSSDKLYRNEGGTVFTDVSKEAGVDAYSFGLGVVCSDLNHDGWVDIYVANDYERPDYMYINQRNGTFVNQLNERIKHTAFTAMGCDAADLNNDGFVDLTVLDMQAEDHQRSKTNMPSMQPENFWSYVSKGYNYQYMSNVLQMNNGTGFFSDVAQMAGIASTDWSWAVLASDFDQDGWNDLYVTNGINRDIRNNDFALSFEEKLEQGVQVNLFEMVEEAPVTLTPNYLFHNKGNFHFEKTTDDWGLAEPAFSFGAITADLDQDGDLDLIVNNNNAHPFIYENQVSTGNWLQVAANAGTMNQQGLGTKAIAFVDGEIRYQELTGVRAYQSSSEPIMHFGLGEQTVIDSLLVIFPDGKAIKRYDVPANQRITFNSKEAKVQAIKVYDFKPALLRDYSQAIASAVPHQENAYDDFSREILLPHKQSEHGPALAVGDINGDGLEDAFLGASIGFESQFLLQNKQGGFDVRASGLKDEMYEDVSAILFDADQDGDQDLVVASGGYEFEVNSSRYAARLYMNNSGSFERASAGAWPEITTNASVVKALDWDLDGDVDVFLAGGVLPGKYPQIDRSYLLENLGDGKFSAQDVSDLLGQNGVITDVRWANLEGDESPELIAVGEWMSPSIFTWGESGLEKSPLSLGLEAFRGWWWSIDLADVDNDGQLDLLLGNMGENTKFHVSNKKPLRVYAKDFDGNGTNDVVLSKSYKDEFVPVRGRECSSEQMPFVKEKFTDYKSFSEANIQEVLGAGIDDALYLEVNEFRSGIAYRDGSGWRFEALPALAQISALKSIIARDLNGDGRLDLVLAGNHFGAEVETTRHDASNGLVLVQMADGSFEERRVLESGFYAPGNVVDMQCVFVPSLGKEVLIVASNNSRYAAFVLGLRP